ncbi:MAG TPA: hypothetical protein VL123_00540 [Candidatus Udaeobacter sp.]|nr:hypothetical protein [Candidatus Udaeobacter sp.]
MRRATLSLVTIALLLTVAAPAAWCQGNQLVNGIGLIDYSRRPDFKVGDWVKYHVTGHSSKGSSDEYDLTIAIAGEELLWGEPCFWVETSTESKSNGTVGIATLMSYSVFDDSLPSVNMQYYTRKNVTETDENGNPVEVVARRPPVTLKTRNDPKNRVHHLHVDTLGVETIRIPKGEFVCKHLKIKEDLGVEIERPDSTRFSETRDFRDTYVSRRIPVTGVAREDIEFTSSLKAWMVGRSSDAPSNVVTHSIGQAVLVDYGSGYAGSLVPASKRRSIREQEAESRPAAPKARRVTTPRKSG